MNQMLCGYRDDERLWDAADTAEAMRAKQVEDYADNMMDECKNLNHAVSINSDNDLYDGDLLPKMMAVIAQWNGALVSGETSSHDQMKKLYNLLAGEFQKIAEREVEA